MKLYSFWLWKLEFYTKNEEKHACCLELTSNLKNKGYQHTEIHF